MRLLRWVLSTLGRGSPHLTNARIVDRLMDEIEAQLQSEVDYLQEASAMQWFAAQASHPCVVYAEPVMTHCSKQVLTRTFLPGLHLKDWLLTMPSQELRDSAGWAHGSGRRVTVHWPTFPAENPEARGVGRPQKTLMLPSCHQFAIMPS